MMEKSIYTNQIYIVKITKGISGFKQIGKFDTYMVRGNKARNGRGFYDSIERYCPADYRKNMFEIMDGHLPGFRPVVSPEAAYEYVSNTPSGECQLMDK